MRGGDCKDEGFDDDECRRVACEKSRGAATALQCHGYGVVEFAPKGVGDEDHRNGDRFGALEKYANV